MCYGLILALPDSATPPPTAPDSQMTVWRVDNPWVSLALGAGYGSWVVGDGNHCSCGRVARARDSDALRLDAEAAAFIAEAADRSGHAVFLVHYFPGSFEDEELVAEIGESVASASLRSQVERDYRPDVFVWVAGAVSRISQQPH